MKKTEVVRSGRTKYRVILYQSDGGSVGTTLTREELNQLAIQLTEIQRGDEFTGPDETK